MAFRCCTRVLVFALFGVLTGQQCPGAKELFDGLTADRRDDDVATTPSWTLPDAFLPVARRGGPLGWPAVRPECRPGAYWWWPGSAVTKEDLTWNLQTYRRAGWGNLGVIGIYGVRGEEKRFIDIFSPQWLERFNYTVDEAKRLAVNIDLTPSSGWRMGGPHVTAQYGEQVFAVEDGRIVAKPVRAKVKRAGPGGAGLTINPYSKAAVQFQLDWIDRRFAEGGGRWPRAFYYDSFENPGNWCPEFLDAFRRLRRYALQQHARALAGRGDPDHARRVLCDYRETLSDLLIDRVKQIARWAAARGSALRVQAHGAPANLLDMYAAGELPETEVFGATRFDIPGYRRDPRWTRPDRHSDLVNRLASSAAHVAGRPLVIAESFTWLRNHYHTALSHIKAESDNLLLNGINGIFYHGICYAPKKTAWPGWLFYASTQANARNSIFRDVPVVNAYITRCQSILQQGRPYNDVLLYWPVYDLWMSGGKREQRLTVHHPEWIDETACGQAGRWMIDHGYTFDFISDRQLRRVRWTGRRLRTEGGGQYRAILVPAAKFMKLETAKHLLELARSGATVLVWKELPRDVPGWPDHADRRARLRQLWEGVAADAGGVASLVSSSARCARRARMFVGRSGTPSYIGCGRKAALGKGTLIVGEDLSRLLQRADIDREPLVDCGLKFIRRRCDSHITYFIVNHSAKPVSGWVPLASPCRSAVLMDPMTARTGVAPTRSANGRTEVYLQMEPGQTRVLRVFAQQKIDGPAWRIRRRSGPPVTIQGRWHIEFVEGGPVLPASVSANELKCWTQLGGEEAKRFAGAARYTIAFSMPQARADGWVLQLGDVRESARVWINGQPAGAVVAHPFRIDVAGLVKPGKNQLVVEVTNLSANRIRDLDRRGVKWKKFYDINLVDQRYKPFDASRWGLTPSGLLGPVTLIPYRAGSEGQPP